MTYKQILKKYDGDESVASAIVEAKKSSAQLSRDHIKPHPELPGLPVTWLGITQYSYVST